MSSKIVAWFGVTFILCSCWGHTDTSESNENIPMERLDSSPEDLNRDNSAWRFWKPFRFFKWDSQRTVTRRDSSLISKRYLGDDKTDISTARPSTTRVYNEPPIQPQVERPKGSIRNELITMMFESMIGNIVESWVVINPPKPEEPLPKPDIGSSPSELTVTSRRRKSIAKPSARTKRSRSIIEDDLPMDPIYQCWWSSPNERAIIHFKNGNIYEGSISMKCMHGQGRFQWSDGTVYIGQFQNNEIKGKGTIHWKDDTWYQGDFAGNLRHGHGLYVDSRKQRSYIGGWHCGTKHGDGIIHYSSFNNTYDGEWVQNVRHGYGTREYCEQSGYKGDWDRYIREGNGVMIWPNHDFYRGEWKNGVMSGYGIYIWDCHRNNTMSTPCLSAYRGIWEKGQRDGHGVLNLGLGFGAHYKGEFKKNKKHGNGKLVSNNGLILQDKNLFVDDNLGPVNPDFVDNTDVKKGQHVEPLRFDICDDTVGLMYHVENALKNIDRQAEIRGNMINDYLENNRILTLDISMAAKRDDSNQVINSINYEDLVEFEEISLRKSLRCYETDLKNIYDTYATICTDEIIEFKPILIRLYLWQLYYDCKIHEKGLTLVEIDKMFHKNQQWLARNAHNPFEQIFFWQFIHSLISVASKLYAKRQLPGTKPDTILASAFRTFMDNDVLPGVGSRRGYLANGYGSYVPLKGTYQLYRDLGEPHTVRHFLCAVRHPPHDVDKPPMNLTEIPDNVLPTGRNAYVIGDEITFVTDNENIFEQDSLPKESEDNLKLFNFANLSSKTIINIFSEIFPQLCNNGKIMDLHIELSFFEFFEAFVACALESIKVKEEEIVWREKLLSESTAGVDAKDSVRSGRKSLKNN